MKDLGRRLKETVFHACMHKRYVKNGSAERVAFLPVAFFLNINRHLKDLSHSILSKVWPRTKLPLN